MKKIFLCILLTLSGCSMHFVKDGASSQDLKKDWTNCQVKAGQAGYANAGMLPQREFMQQCMEGEGWARE